MLAVCAALPLGSRGSEPALTCDPARLAARVKIVRDTYGVPHVHGMDDIATTFGFAYAQAEDHFWQVEDSYILALGRYAEVYGPRGLNSDLLNRAFEVVPSSRADFEKLDRHTRILCEAFVAGLNFYLDESPDHRARLLERFEPWHVLAFHRHVLLELCYRYTRQTSNFLPRQNPPIWAATGSNAWAIGPARTASGGTMLMAGPHLPWYGLAQLYEAHLQSDAGINGRTWNFSGATFLGNPTLTIGHNEYLGWTLTTNEPDIADVWSVRFADDSLDYEYDGAFRTATEWEEKIAIRQGSRLQETSYKFRKTHHGPVVARQSDGSFLAARISGLYDVVPTRQAMRMMQARNLEDFRDAITLLQLPYMNIVYADRDGNIFYVYGARCPRRDPDFTWDSPVDGSTSAAEWKGIHGLSELPQVLNPPAGFIQNCNSSPFITSDGGNPVPGEFPTYMIEDADQHKRRALRSLEMLRTMKDVRLDDLERAAFDTEVYWARHDLPGFAEQLDTVREMNPALAEQVEPLLRHLLAWDGKITADSTAATLCESWYEEMYGRDYPGETLRARYVDDPERQMASLLRAATMLERIHGDWKVPYGRLHRIQRRAFTADLFSLRFQDRTASLASLGGHGPMGVVFTQYYTPSIYIPLVINQKKRYGVVGAAYLAIYEFTSEGVTGRSVVPYGASGDPDSPHFFDQAELLSATRMKPIPFTPQQVEAAAVTSYRPGERDDDDSRDEAADLP